MAEALLKEVYPPKGGAKYDIKERYKGADLVGTEYVPLFSYYESKRADGCFRVLADTYVTSDTGTGIVHCAPGFGADDYRVALKAQIISASDPPVPIDENGRFKDIVKDFSGIYVKDADKEVRKYLKNAGTSCCFE
jgi:isoleucyl-tRNA synthetase